MWRKMLCLQQFIQRVDKKSLLTACCNITDRHLEGFNKSVAIVIFMSADINFKQI